MEGSVKTTRSASHARWLSAECELSVPNSSTAFRGFKVVGTMGEVKKSSYIVVCLVAQMIFKVVVFSLGDGGSFLFLHC